MIKKGQLRSKTVNYGQKQSITVKNSQFWSKPVNYSKKKLSITVINGQTFFPWPASFTKPYKLDQRIFIRHCWP